MEIKVFNNTCIITPLSPVLDEREIKRLITEIKEYKNFKIGINLSFVQNCNIKFFESIMNNKNINLFNIPINIFIIINLMNIDKKIKLFSSELDFIENKRQLLNRKFQLIK